MSGAQLHVNGYFFHRVLLYAANTNDSEADQQIHHWRLQQQQPMVILTNYHRQVCVVACMSVLCKEQAQHSRPALLAVHSLRSILAVGWPVTA